MADTELQDLATAITTLDGDELVYVVDDPAGTPASRKMTATNLAKSTRSLIHGYENLPFWADATTFLTCAGIAASAGTLTANRFYMLPVRVPYRRAMTKMAAVVTALSASTGLRVGVYNANQQTGQPTTLIEDAGIIDTSTGTGATGRIEKTLTSTLDPGLYYLAGLSDGAPTVLRTGAPITSVLGIQFGAATLTSNGFIFRNSVTYQAFSNYADESGQTYSIGASNGLVLGIR
jgi:hypothetical protein